MTPAPVLVLAASLLVGAASVACLYALRKQDQHTDHRRSKHRRKTATPNNTRFKRTMCEHEYVALIPPGELKQLKQLLRRIYQQRGWSTQLTGLDAAWAATLAAAQSAQGGGWHEGRFGEGQLCVDSLQKLSMVVDEHFLAGALQRALLDAGKQAVGFRVQEEAAGPDDWISYFDERQNQIVLRRHRWGPDCLAVSEERPMSCEGLLCTSNLQVLAHTLAHEMVHALVFHLFPAIDAASQAYLPDERHGPIFKLLNKRLFGHSIDSFRPVFRT